MKKNWTTVLILIFILAVATGWKIFLLVQNLVPFNADEAIVALMARHILQGERPAFFYGQAYMGSLDAYLVAIGFLFFGQQVWVIRIVQAVLYLGTLISTVWVGHEAFPGSKSGLIAAALLAIPTVNVTLYTTASLGGYGETLLIGNLLLALALGLARKPSYGRLGLWGFLAGLGLWADGLTLVYSLPGFIYLIWELKTSKPALSIRCAGATALGGVLGSLPWWLFALRHGFFQLLIELLGSAVSVERVSWLERTGQHLVNLLLVGLPAAFGLRPPWSVDWLVVPLLPLVLAAWIAVFLFIIRKIARGGESRAVYGLLGGVILVLLLGFLFTSFGVDPSGRYFLPLAVPMALAAAEMGRSIRKPGWVSYALFGLFVVYQIGGNVQVALRFPPGLTTQFDQRTIIDHRYDSELAAFLRAQGETRGYANYWVSYPLDFTSGEELVFVPRLPYHPDLRYTTRDDRYAPFDDLVAQSQKTAYISVEQTPLLDERLRSGLQSLGVTYQEKVIGDYHIFFALSRPVRPQELGLGETNE